MGSKEQGDVSERVQRDSTCELRIGPRDFGSQKQVHRLESSLPAEVMPKYGSIQGSTPVVIDGSGFLVPEDSNPWDQLTVYMVLYLRAKLVFF